VGVHQDLGRGDTFGAMSVSGVEAFHASFTDLLFEVLQAS